MRALAAGHPEWYEQHLEGHDRLPSTAADTVLVLSIAVAIKLTSAR